MGRGVFRGGGLAPIGVKPPPGPVKSIDFRVFHAPTGAEPPPWKEKNLFPPPLDKFLKTPLDMGEYIYLRGISRNTVKEER